MIFERIDQLFQFSAIIHFTIVSVSKAFRISELFMSSYRHCLFLCNISMPPAILAEIMSYDGVHLLTDFACEVADFLAFQVHANGRTYLNTEVRGLMEQ